MARPLRIEFPGALYHITSRGNAKQSIYLNDKDRHDFLTWLGKVCKRFRWCCYAYCLMPNHYHLVIETCEATLSKGMRQLNGVYTQKFNRSHRRVGHVFQGRYKSIVVDKDNYLLELIRYVLLNPVRAHITETVGQYPWSSYRAMTGKVVAPEWLAKERVLMHFGKRINHAQQQFIHFIREGKGQPVIWEQLRHQIYLGDEQFVLRLKPYISDVRDLSEIPRTQRCVPAKSLDDYAEIGDMRMAMCNAYATGEFTYREIANYFGVHYSTVSRAVNKK